MVIFYSYVGLPEGNKEGFWCILDVENFENLQKI